MWCCNLDNTRLCFQKVKRSKNSSYVKTSCFFLLTDQIQAMKTWEIHKRCMAFFYNTLSCRCTSSLERKNDWKKMNTSAKICCSDLFPFSISSRKTECRQHSTSGIHTDELNLWLESIFLKKICVNNKHLHSFEFSVIISHQEMPLIFVGDTFWPDGCIYFPEKEYRHFLKYSCRRYLLTLGTHF